MNLGNLLTRFNTFSVTGNESTLVEKHREKTLGTIIGASLATTVAPIGAHAASQWDAPLRDMLTGFFEVFKTLYKYIVSFSLIALIIFLAVCGLIKLISHNQRVIQMCSDLMGKSFRTWVLINLLGYIAILLGNIRGSVFNKNNITDGTADQWGVLDGTTN